MKQSYEIRARHKVQGFDTIIGRGVGLFLGKPGEQYTLIGDNKILLREILAGKDGKTIVDYFIILEIPT